MTLTGITLVKDGNKLNYPWKECINSMSEYCDEVIVNVGLSTDWTVEDFRDLQFKNRKLHKWPKLSVWSMANTGDGSELARQANLILPVVTTDWVLYLQADEFLLTEDAYRLRLLLEGLQPEITQVELFRTYFYGDLKTRLDAEEIWLGRIFRKGTHTVGGDGMYLNRLEGEVARLPFKILHYSRMGTEEQIDRRVKNLDRLFHPEEKVVTFPAFKYDERVTSHYVGPHPTGIIEFYDRYR